MKSLNKYERRKEGNDQESIQLPTTFRSKTPKGKKDALKATAPQSKHYKQKAKRTVPFPKISQTAIQNKNFTRTNMQWHTMTEIVNHSRSIVFERSVKILLGALNQFDVATTLALSSIEVYTRQLFSPRLPFSQSVMCSLFQKAIFLTFIRYIHVRYVF